MRSARFGNEYGRALRLDRLGERFASACFFPPSWCVARGLEEPLVKPEGGVDLLLTHRSDL